MEKEADDPAGAARGAQEVPPKVAYSLTDLGQSLNAALGPLGLWGDAHMETLIANKDRAANRTTNRAIKGKTVIS
ncbi:winged helix-turn-helix transcriptional regulator [Actinomycetota bacterium Odt1-20B]